MGVRDFSGIFEPDIYTLHDLTHRLVLRTMGDGTERMKALCVRSIQDAIRSMPKKHPWSYYNRQARFVTTAPFSPTVEYDVTGGTYELQVTITSADVWPADATYGEIVIGTNPYRISRRISDTVATLESDFAYASDYTGVVTWERRAYQFSREVAKIHYLKSISANRLITYMPSVEFEAANHTRWTGGLTTHFTWYNQGNRFGSAEVVLLPSPSTSEAFEATAIVTPIIPKVELVSGEGAAVSGSTVTVAGESFTDKLIGCIFRVGRDSIEPTEFESANYSFQAFITAVPSATTLTLSETIPSAVTDKGYAISSPIDIDSTVMLECLEDEAYYQYTKNHDHKGLLQAKQVAMASLREAICIDNGRVSLNSHLWNAGGWWGRWYGGFYTINEEEEA